ncbi:ABC transporter ATP-binding protein [Lysobacter humi (ex Lee et al. 2017)]
MNAYLRAQSISLELPLDLQREGVTADAGSLKASLGGRERLHRRILSGIDFTAEEGDRIGLLGLNGAGKTTLLRVLNGAFPPTTGRVERRGSTQSLLNPTLGFDEHATVVENVFLRGTAMGLRRVQLKSVLADILQFAGLAAKAGHPLHTLSAGQRMRLGFAISTAIQPDILLMDEWLSTGDAAFLERAQQRMRSRFQGSRIVVLASHSPALVRIMCNKALVLDEGRMAFFGPVEDAMGAYRQIVSGASAAMREELAKDDPMLFGGVAGVIERIRLDHEVLAIEGWAADGQEREVAVVCVEVDGRAQFFEDFERLDRDDVRLHLGRKRGRFGFRIELRVPITAVAHELAERVSVSTGASRQKLGRPLPLARAGIVEIA